MLGNLCLNIFLPFRTKEGDEIENSDQLEKYRKLIEEYKQTVWNAIFAVEQVFSSSAHRTHRTSINCF